MTVNTVQPGVHDTARLDALYTPRAEGPDADGRRRRLRFRGRLSVAVNRAGVRQRLATPRRWWCVRPGCSDEDVGQRIHSVSGRPDPGVAEQLSWITEGRVAVAAYDHDRVRRARLASETSSRRCRHRCHRVRACRTTCRPMRRGMRRRYSRPRGLRMRTLLPRTRSCDHAREHSGVRPILRWRCRTPHRMGYNARSRSSLLHQHSRSAVEIRRLPARRIDADPSESEVGSSDHTAPSKRAARVSEGPSAPFGPVDEFGVEQVDVRIESR